METVSVLRRVISIGRIVVGICAIAAGVKFLQDADFLYGGLYYQLREAGSPFPFYRRILERMEYRQELLAYSLCFCAIAFGASYLLGALVSLASVGAAFLVLNFAMATAAGNVLWLLLLVLVAFLLLAMGFVGAGLYLGVDGWLVEHINERLILLPLRLRLPTW